MVLPSLLDSETYEEVYQRSIRSPEEFWSDLATRYLHWFSPWKETLSFDYSRGTIRWFSGGTLNVSYNCLDRHLETRGDQTAILWEKNDPGEHEAITYRQLHRRVCRAANILKKLGVKKGDTVCLYLPMIPELPVLMLACARIGAIHSVVFAGFSAEALRIRLLDTGCALVITSDEGLRGTKRIPLKEIVDQAVGETEVRKILVCKRTGASCPFNHERDLWFHEIEMQVDDHCPAEPMDAEDPLFVLYTSGSTGKPKGVLHTTGGYLLYAAVTHRHVFDLQEGDIYFCTADIGWVTGHSYLVYGPLCNGTTSILFESTPMYPDPSRLWQMVEQHKVNILYTAPTAIRTLEKESDDFVTRHDRSSLRVLGTVGEPINPSAWEWYHTVVGEDRCPIVDTWWQTETGGVLISPFPSTPSLKPGSAMLPFFGVHPVIVDDAGQRLAGNEVTGRLCFDRPWPGQMRGVYRDEKRFFDTYFTQVPGMYFSGDACRRDDDGDYWILGRVDDVVNVAGHRLGTAEIESAIVASGVVVEAAVVGIPHSIKGESLHAFCIPFEEHQNQTDAIKRIQKSVREQIGSFAVPDKMILVPGLPKTRSGKIMRRILRAIAMGDETNVGDISTLAEPGVVEMIREADKMS